MATIHRNGIPPKRLPYKVVISFTDMEFNEAYVVQWCKDNLLKAAQYDFTKFNGSKGKLNRSIELTVWFQSKKDAKMFEEAWSE